MEEQKLRAALIDAARRIDRRNMQTNNGGNFSARLSKCQMLIKPGDSEFSSILAEELVYADFFGRGIKDGGKPSKEAILHGQLYIALTQVAAIMHCHSPWATAWAEHADSLGMSTWHSSVKLGAVVPVFDTGGYVVAFEDAADIAAQMRDKYPDSRAFILRRHGVVAFGASVRDAASCAELVEETAMIAAISRMVGAANGT